MLQFIDAKPAAIFDVVFNANKQSIGQHFAHICKPSVLTCHSRYSRRLFFFLQKKNGMSASNQFAYAVCEIFSERSEPILWKLIEFLIDAESKICHRKCQSLECSWWHFLSGFSIHQFIETQQSMSMKRPINAKYGVIKSVMRLLVLLHMDVQPNIYKRLK